MTPELRQPELPELICDVCSLEVARGVAAVPGVPMSVAYCQSCLDANAHPYWVLVANTAGIGGLEQAAPWWRQMVTDTLTHLGKDRDVFDAAVAVEIQALHEMERQAYIDYVPGEGR